ncbi:hypothetical protein [Vibrio sp. SCSIO 43136]|uniref:hypothetical protein n=1 Tax=Vibrio sp. SCSIO 43136 TaxID=2819101 RepID=UPI0020756614|nr:hypothetical protein [Vibrio sp. SCSIO 43136]
MKWLKAVPVIGQLVLKLINYLEQRKLKQQLEQQEQERDEIKRDPYISHKRRFGRSSGRVSIGSDDDSYGFQSDSSD